MPKFIGNVISGAKQIQDNAGSLPGYRVKLTYSQASRLPPEQVFCSLDTSDRGGKGSYAKRWYRWFSHPDYILSCDKSTEKMKEAAKANLEAEETKAALSA